jgi:serine/threonine-protein kinase
MGVVVEAKDNELGERVAIKVLRQRHCDNEEAVARFQREARSATQIRGDHSVRIIEVGTTKAGTPFIVMELLEGSDLARILRTGSLPVTDAVLYILQACEGMAEVHAHGIIHRDLKPDNLFVTCRVDGTPLVKVLDYGIAKNVVPMDEDDAKITMTFVALGTPLYMSPEQIRCSKSVDVRTDVWSLGAILYQLIAGKPPFGGSSVTSIAAQVLESEPQPLPTLRPEVPPELDQVIARALSKTSDQRYPDVAALAQALAPFAGEAGAYHAARAARLLRGEERGSWVVPVAATALGTEPPPDAEVHLEREEVTRLLPPRSRPYFQHIGLRFANAVVALDARWALIRLQIRRVGPFVVTSAVALLAGWTVMTRIVEQDTPILAAEKGLRAQSAPLRAAVSAAAQLTATADPGAGSPPGDTRQAQEERRVSPAPTMSAAASAPGSRGTPPPGSVRVVRPRR